MHRNRGFPRPAFFVSEHNAIGGARPHTTLDRHGTPCGGHASKLPALELPPPVTNLSTCFGKVTINFESCRKIQIRSKIRRPPSRAPHDRCLARRDFARSRSKGKTVALVPTMGALACRPSGTGAPGAPACRMCGGFDLRQSEPIRAKRGFRQLSAHLGRRPGGLGAAEGRCGLGTERRHNVSGGVRKPGSRRGGRPLSGLRTSSARIFSAGFAPWLPSCLLQVATRHRNFRRKGLPAAQGRHRHGARSGHSGQNCRACRRCARAMAWRCRRATPTSPSASGRRRPALYHALKDCAARLRQGVSVRQGSDRRPGCDRGRRLRRRLPGGAPRQDIGADRLDRRTARCGCWSPPGSAAPG